MRPAKRGGGVQAASLRVLSPGGKALRRRKEKPYWSGHSGRAEPHSPGRARRRNVVERWRSASRRPQGAPFAAGAAATTQRDPRAARRPPTAPAVGGGGGRQPGVRARANRLRTRRPRPSSPRALPQGSRPVWISFRTSARGVICLRICLSAL
eukprot:5044304-Prymnesium_polylepis.1